MRGTTEVYYTVILASIFFVLLVTIIVISIWRYHAKKQAYELSLIQFEQTLMQSRLEIQEETFKSISREMHDNIGQMLTLAKLNINTLDLAHPSPAKAKLDETAKLISESAQILRDISKSLQGGALKEVGLFAALQAEAARLNKTGILRATFSEVGDGRNIDDKKGLIVFRIVQEALHNVMKHANATAVDIHAETGDNSLVLKISDNGKGLQGITSTRGSGLQNMKDRARIAGGRLDINSSDTGTTIILTLPL